MNGRVTEETTYLGDAVVKKVDAIVVLVTCKSKPEARRIVTALVAKRLAACGNILESRADVDLSLEAKG